jgi:hypothetical protein
MLEVRKRVFLKSPVREIRTPGSARGASGNRRVYRDYKIARGAATSCGGDGTYLEFEIKSVYK